MSSNLFSLKNLIWFCAIGLAAFSGYYSVFGISKLFSGGSWSIIGMAAMLELSKLVVVAFLHNHFRTLKLLFKTYLVSAAIVLMAITSIGVYGYLTNSYQETAKVVYKTQNEITLLDQKKKLFQEQKIQLDKSIEEKNSRLKSLDQIRVSQQSAYTQQLTQKRGTGGLSKNIASIDKSSEGLNNDISLLTQKSFALSDSIAAIEQTKLTLNNETFSSELGPLLYLSRITGIPMDIVVNWFILILVVVFDPLAVSLVIAANHLSKKNKNENINHNDPDLTQPTTEVIESEAPSDVIDATINDEIGPLDIDMGSIEVDGMDSVVIPVTSTSDIDYSVTPTHSQQKVKNLLNSAAKKKRLQKRNKSSILIESKDVNSDEQREFYEENSTRSDLEALQKPTIKYTRGVSL